MTVLIAEVKTHSPWGFRSERSWDELFELAEWVGDWIAVHTDPRWGGSFDLVAEARHRTEKPVLAKGVHRTDHELRLAFAAGADYALVVGREPAIHPDRCLVEPHTLSELAALPCHRGAVWNQRDLLSGSVKPESFAEARAAFDGWLCQASFLEGPQDVHPDADAVLVGSKLPEFVEERSGG